MHLVVFTIEIYYDARPYERQNYSKQSIWLLSDIISLVMLNLVI